MNTFNRRKLLQLGASTGLVFGFSALPRWARAQSANNKILVMMFLRGGADGMSFLHPEPGSSAARAKYQAWRGTATRIDSGIPVARGLAMHPALAPLQSLIAARELCFVPGLGGAQFNRSHFEQQDLVESGAGETGSPRTDGFLGRALDVMPNHRTEATAAIALSAIAPYSLRFSGRPALSVRDFAGFGELEGGTLTANVDRPLKERLTALHVPNADCANAVCTAARSAVQGIETIESLRAATNPFPADRFAQLASIIRADASQQLKFVTLDAGGWDTHNMQGNDDLSGGSFIGTLASNIEGLAIGLRALYDAAKAEGVWNRITVAVMSEFGRTTRQNGSQGTDHGFGGVGLLLGSGFRSPVYGTGWFPANASASFYTEAEGNNVLPRLVDYRQVFSQVLRDRFAVTASELETSVFPGLTIDTALPRVFV